MKKIMLRPVMVVCYGQVCINSVEKLIHCAMDEVGHKNGAHRSSVNFMFYRNCIVDFRYAFKTTINDCFQARYMNTRSN